MTIKFKPMFATFDVKCKQVSFLYSQVVYIITFLLTVQYCLFFCLNGGRFLQTLYVMAFPAEEWA